MIKKRTVLPVLALTLAFSSALAFPASAAGTWNDSNFDDAYSSAHRTWTNSYGIGFSRTTTLARSDFYSTTDTYPTFGETVPSTWGDSVTRYSSMDDQIDAIARTIYSEVINVKPRVDNAFAVAQVMYNRMHASGYGGSTGIDVASASGQFAYNSYDAFWDPQDDNYNVSWSEPYYTQEDVFTYATFLAEDLYKDRYIRTTTTMGDRVATDVGDRLFFYDISDNIPFYYGTSKIQCTASNVESAEYYLSPDDGQYHPITQSVIKIGDHVYYTYQ